VRLRGHVLVVPQRGRQVHVSQRVPRGLALLLGLVVAVTRAGWPVILVHHPVRLLRGLLPAGRRVVIVIVRALLSLLRSLPALKDRDVEAGRLEVGSAQLLDGDL